MGFTCVMPIQISFLEEDETHTQATNKPECKHSQSHEMLKSTEVEKCLKFI